MKSGMSNDTWMDGLKEKLVGTSNRGDSYFRWLLVHGARSIANVFKGKDDRLSQWVIRNATTRHTNDAAVAMANKATLII